LIQAIIVTPVVPTFWASFQAGALMHAVPPSKDAAPPVLPPVKRTFEVDSSALPAGPESVVSFSIRHQPSRPFVGITGREAPSQTPAVWAASGAAPHVSVTGAPGEQAPLPSHVSPLVHASLSLHEVPAASLVG
jgi:hypothetical protein